METNLVFLCGFPSSGTDLLKNILNAHPAIFIAGEFPFLPTLFPKYGAIVSGDAVDQLVGDLKRIDVYHNFCNASVTISPIRQEHSLAELYSRMLSTDERRWKGNKTPQNTENINKLKILFPQAKFIVIVRDVRDVALSWQKKWGKNQRLCASKWDLRMRRGYQMLQDCQDDYLIVKYESLINDFTNTAKGICAFLGISFHDNLLQFDKYVNTIVEGKLNYGRPILRNNCEKWRKELDRATVKRIEEIAWHSLALFGYSVEAAKGPKGITNLEKCVGVAVDLFALVFVGNRGIKRNKLRYRIGRIVYEVRKFLVMKYGIR
jgi:hypothetical protein